MTESGDFVSPHLPSAYMDSLGTFGDFVSPHIRAECVRFLIFLIQHFHFVRGKRAVVDANIGDRVVVVKHSVFDKVFDILE